FIDASHTSAYEHDGVHRHTMRAGGLGDLRLVGNAWLFDPAKSPNGNIGLSAGFKAPTGNYRAHDYSYQASGPVLRPVDFSIQPGDGGWGAVLEFQAFQKVFEEAYLYASGLYLINPRNVNGTETTVPFGGAIQVNSVPDQYMARGG